MFPGRAGRATGWWIGIRSCDGPIPVEHTAGGAFDLKAFSRWSEDPAEVTAADAFDFLADQRDRNVVRLADRESGLSARTIARRLSSVSGLYAYLIARGIRRPRVKLERPQR